VKTIKEEKGKIVNFSLEAPQAQRVTVAGDFNQWNPRSHPMKKDWKGIWEISLVLPPGAYQYRFLVDDDWRNDPTCSECVQNLFGTLNCVKRIE
jgi:1,4-alpha-glucan branching enzyme